MTTGMAARCKDDERAAVTDGDEGEDESSSYIDYEAFLAPDFNSAAFANTLVLATNNPTDTPLDLSTPLSRVLFDIQEIDSRLDSLATRSAIPLLLHTQNQNDASARILADIDSQLGSVNDSYQQLEKQVTQRYAEAQQVREVVSRLWETLKLGRAVSRILQLARQLEAQHAELPAGRPHSATLPCGESHGALVRCAQTILSLRQFLEPCDHRDCGDDDRMLPFSEYVEGLDRVTVVRTLRDTLISPLATSVCETAQRIVREFSVSPTSGDATFSHAVDTRSRTMSALHTLVLLSPTTATLGRGEKWAPTLMLQACEAFIRTALQSSLAALARSLAALPSLDRALSEVAARCQNVVALEAVLDAAKVPTHAMIPAQRGDRILLHFLLASLETGSLASYFWRTLAAGLSHRVQDIMHRGGVAARTLRTNKSQVADAIADCVLRGSRLSSSISGGSNGSGGVTTSAASKAKGISGTHQQGNGPWEREVAVMVASVAGNISR